MSRPNRLRAVLALILPVALLAPLGASAAETPQTAPPASRPPVQPAPAAAPASPCPIVADPPGVDFGVVEPGTKVEATIRLLNPLDRPVAIKLSRPSCTCTTVDMVGKVIPAKGSIDMPMAMQTSRSVGMRTAMVTLVFDGIQAPLAVKIDAETAYAVRANPAYIDALAPERMQGFFELIASDGTPFTVRTVDGKPAQAPDGVPVQPGTRQIVRYDLASPGLTQGVPPFVIVETDHPKCPVLDLRVRHETTRITPAIALAEFRSNVGIVPAKGTVEFEIELKHMGAARVERVTSNRKEWKAELVGQKADGDSVLLKVRLTDLGAMPGPFLFTVALGSGPKSADLWIYGVLR